MSRRSQEAEAIKGNDAGRYPRTLIVSHDAFAARGAGGIVLTNLFRDWPRERLAIVDYSTGAPDPARCGCYWRLSKWGILRATMGLPGHGALRLDETGGEEAGRPEANSGRRRFSLHPRNLSVHVRHPVGEAIFRLPGVLSQPLRNWIRAFRPEVCFSTLGTGLMTRTVVRIAEDAGVPVVPYFCDDWIRTLYRGDVMEGWLRRSAHRWLEACFGIAPLRLVITEYMVEEYERRYGGTFIPIEHAVMRTGHVESLREPGRTPVRIVYVGGLTPDRAGVVREIGEALASLEVEGLPSRFSVYVPPAELAGKEAILNLPPVMKTLEAVPYSEVPEVLEAADVVVHAESFDPVYREWTRFSMSTKIPEYMMAGRCIFAYGPAEIASIRYLRDTGSGLVVDRQGVDELRRELRGILRDGARRKELGERARAMALERHDAVVQRERFLSAIRRACGKDEPAGGERCGSA